MDHIHDRLPMGKTFLQMVQDIVSYICNLEKFFKIHRIHVVRGKMYQRGMHMKEHITTPKMSEILLEEFMEPMGLSAYRVAQGIHVPTSRIQDILHDRRKITADTSLRLAKFFGVSDRYYG